MSPHVGSLDNPTVEDTYLQRSMDCSFVVERTHHLHEIGHRDIATAIRVQTFECKSQSILLTQSRDDTEARERSALSIKMKNAKIYKASHYAPWIN